MRRPTRLVAAAIVAALLLIGTFAVVAIQAAYSSDLGVETSKLSATAAVTAELVEREMRSVEALEQATIEQPNFIASVGQATFTHYDSVGLRRVLDHVAALRSEFQFAAVSDAAGALLELSPSAPLLVGSNFAYRDWYRGVTRTGQSYVSSAYVSATPGAPLLVAVATPIRIATAAEIRLSSPPTGPVIGALLIGYKIGSLQAFADRIAGLEQVDLELIDQSGVLMARRGGISGQLSRVSGIPEVDAALAGRAGSGTSSGDIGVGSPIPGLGWAVRASMPPSATVAAAQRRTTTAVALGMLMVLALGGATLVRGTRRLARADARHAASEAELQTVLGSLTESITVYDAGGELVSANAATERLLGFQEHAVTGRSVVAEQWVQIRQDGSALPPDESPLALVRRTGIASQEVVMGIRRLSDRTVRWLSVSTVPIRRGGGAVSGYVSSATDITERMETMYAIGTLRDASEELSASLQPTVVMRALTRAAAILCTAPGGPRRGAQMMVIEGSMFTVVAQHHVANLQKLSGVRLPIAEHPYLQRVIKDQDAVAIRVHAEEFGPSVAALLQQAQVGNCAWIPVLQHGVVAVVLGVSGAQQEPLSAAQLDRLKTLASMGALALANANTHERVAQLAVTDPLTGLGNRRALRERMRQLPRIRFAVLAIDVDRLKQINDLHGHAAGDAAIIEVGGALADALRPSDLLARTGGDEFLALLLDCDADRAREVAKRLHAAVARIAFDWGTPTVSLGVAIGTPGGDPAAVAEEADAALYVAKAETRDRERSVEPRPTA